VGHARAPAAEQLHPSWPQLGEALKLALVEGLDAFAGDAAHAVRTLTALRPRGERRRANFRHRVVEASTPPAAEFGIRATARDLQTAPLPTPSKAAAERAAPTRGVSPVGSGGAHVFLRVAARTCAFMHVRVRSGNAYGRTPCTHPRSPAHPGPRARRRPERR